MKSGFRKNRELLLTGLASATLMCGCDSAKSQWKKAPGTRGSINLDSVKKAFINNQSVNVFENRVNEIFEGDNLVIFESTKVGNGFRLSAYEDLDNNKQRSGKDDRLFTLTVKDGIATLKGDGVNSYYKESWPVEQQREEEPTHVNHRHGPYFYHWYGRSWGGRYYTPRENYNTMAEHRKTYRKSEDFSEQVKQNSAYEKSMAGKHPGAFTSSISSLNATRANYIKQTASTKNFSSTKSGNSGWAVRARSGIKSSFGRSSGGFSAKGGFRSSSGFGV